MTRITTKADRYLMNNYLRFPSKCGFSSPFFHRHVDHPSHVCAVCGGTSAKPIWTRFRKVWLCCHECFVKLKGGAEPKYPLPLTLDLPVIGVDVGADGLVQIIAYPKAVEVDNVDPSKK